MEGKEGKKEGKDEGKERRKDGRMEGKEEGRKERRKELRNEGRKERKNERTNKGRKEMFYITMHTMWLLYGLRWSAADLRSTLDIVPLFVWVFFPFPYEHVGRKEGNVLINDALNTFYLGLYGVRHMVKYHSYSKRKPAATTTWVNLSY